MKKYYFIFLIPWVLGVYTAKGQDVGESKDSLEYFKATGIKKCPSEKVMFGGQLYLCNSLTWKLVFEENFDGNTLDLSRWMAHNQGALYGNGGDTQEYQTPNNITVSNGTLKIVSKKETSQRKAIPWEPDNEILSDGLPNLRTYNYTSGEIWSNPKFVQGKLVGRIKIPKGWGFNPAFWMFGNPPWNEIDVFEFPNEWRFNIFNFTYEPRPDLLSKVHHMTVHYKTDASGDSYNCSSNYTDIDFSANFHIFTMIWDKDKIDFYVDGVLKSHHARYYTDNGQEAGCTLYPYTIYIEKPFPRDPMHIILNVAIQHNGGNDPNSSTPFPSQMEVDYVRFYQRLPCYSESTLITNPATLNITDGAFNSVVGTTIKMGDGFTLNSGQHLSARATDKIVLQAGFTAKAGCNFTAKIDPSACNSSKGMEGEIEEDDFFAQEEGEEIIPKKTGQEDIISDIRVFPNPTYDRLFIETPYCCGKTTRYKIQMLNALGIVLQSFATEEYRISMDMNNYSPGLYLLNVINTDTGEVISHKIIKQ